MSGTALNVCLGVFVAVLPLYMRLGAYEVGRISKEVLLLFFLGAASILAVRVRQAPTIAWVAAAAATLACIWNQWEPSSIAVMHQATLIIFGTYGLVAIIRGTNTYTTHHLLNGMAIGCLIQAILAIGEHYWGNAYYGAMQLLGARITITREHLPVGSLGNENCLAAYIAICAPALFRKGWVWLTPVAIAGIAASNSMMGAATIGAAVAFHFFGGKGRWKWFYLAAVAGIASLVALGGLGVDSGRVHGWLINLDMIGMRHLLVGMGPGWFFDHGITIAGTTMRQEHNEILGVLNKFGLMGLAVCALLIRRANKTRPTAFTTILFAAFVNSMGHFTLHQSTTAIVAIIALGVCLAIREDHVFDLEWERSTNAFRPAIRFH